MRYLFIWCSTIQIEIVSIKNKTQVGSRTLSKIQFHQCYSKILILKKRKCHFRLKWTMWYSILKDHTWWCGLGIQKMPFKINMENLASKFLRNLNWAFWHKFHILNAIFVIPYLQWIHYQSGGKLKTGPFGPWIPASNEFEVIPFASIHLHYYFISVISPIISLLYLIIL